MGEMGVVKEKKNFLLWVAKTFGKNRAGEKPLIDEDEKFYAFVSIGIINGHALEKVRTNGYASLNSTLDVFEEIESLHTQLNSEYKRFLKYKNKVDSAYNEARRRMKKFPICPECKGHKHQKYHNEYYCEKCPKNRREKWEDCHVCNGEGVLFL